MKPKFVAVTVFDKQEYKRFRQIFCREYKSNKRALAGFYTLFLGILKIVLDNMEKNSIMYYVVFFGGVAACLFFWFFFKSKLDKAQEAKELYSYIGEDSVSLVAFYDYKLYFMQCLPEGKINFITDKKAYLNEFDIKEHIPKGYLPLIFTETEYNKIHKIYETKTDFYIEIAGDKAKYMAAVSKNSCSEDLTDFILLLKRDYSL